MSCWCHFPSWGLLQGRGLNIWVTEKQSTNTGKVLQLPLFFPKGQCLAEQGSALAEGTGVTLLWGKDCVLHGFSGSSWKGLSFFFVWLILYCLFCIVLVFFPLKWKVLFWIQFLLYRNLQLPGFSRKHGSFGLHFRITCLGFFTHSKSLESVGVIELIVPVWSVCCHCALVRTPPSTPAHLRSTFHCVSCFWLSPVESCTLWELFAVDDISSGNYNCTWIMWNDCLPL